MSSLDSFSYPEHQPDFNLRLIKQTKHYKRFLVDFPVASIDCYPGGEIAKGEYFEPLGMSNNVPLAILIHGWGDHSVIPFKLMVGGFLRRGIACFVLYLPFHGSRLPDEMKPRVSRLTPDEWFTGYQMAVTDVRRIIDWAVENGRIHAKKIAVIGLSLGAFVSSITMGIDQRIKAGVFIVHGGNSGKIMQLNRIAKYRKAYRSSDEEYKENQRIYARYLVEIAGKGIDNIVPEQKTFLIDPLTYTHLLKGRPTMMINALWDELIPQEASLDFCRACGECERVLFPSTHASIWIWYPAIVRKINLFLKSSLDI
ncbi:MAG: alpha/beta hydrolase family protein [Dehalococcoidales bacterium]|nr:alpha/beta hydrolase family protein [Dehalococcoidales bacterium]